MQVKFSTNNEKDNPCNDASSRGDRVFFIEVKNFESIPGCTRGGGWSASYVDVLDLSRSLRSSGWHSSFPSTKGARKVTITSPRGWL